MLGDEHLYPRQTTRPHLRRSAFTGQEPCRFNLSPGVDCGQLPTRPAPEFRTTLCYDHHPDSPGTAWPEYEAKP